MKTKRVVLALGLVLALASFWVVGAASAATPANAIAVRAQDANNGQVYVDSVTAAQTGWLLIHKDSNGKPGGVIGFAPVHQGVNTAITVDIRTTDSTGEDNVTPTLWATLVTDPQALDPLSAPDSTITQEGAVATVAFASSTAAAMSGQLATTGGTSSASKAANANKITIGAQNPRVGYGNGLVLVQSVTAAQDGWLLIRKDNNGAPGNVIGFAPIHQGTNTDVSVDVQTTNSKGDDIITSALWATLMADPNALNPFATPGSNVQNEGGAVAVAFSTYPAAVPASAQVAGQLPTTGGISSLSSSTSANKITISAQNPQNGYVYVDSVTAAQPGWVLIHQDANGAPGNVIGFAPVYQGVNTNVRVAIQTTNSQGNSIITSPLWVTLVPDPTALDPFATPTSDVQGESSLATAAFNTNVP
jgi:hypothetical protein